MAALPGRAGDDRITGEQAALRRVATLVAGGAAPEEVFTAVTETAGRLLGADYTAMTRYDPDGARTLLASWSSSGAALPLGRARLGGQNLSTLVFQTGRAARIDDYDDATGPAAEDARRIGLRAGVGVPVGVEGRLWGVMTVGCRTEPLPAGTEAQLAGFTELAGTAIANAQARVELRGFAAEQAALRRVATLVASGAAPEEVLAAVTEEAGRLLGAHYTAMGRYDPDGARTLVATWDSTGAALPVGTRARLGGPNLPTMVFQTRRPARIDHYASASGPIAEDARELGLRAAVGVPVSVEGRLWGVMLAGSREGPLPAGTEERLAGFTHLAATAIANAEAQAALTASRARIVATADATPRRIERNLHDGAQQRLVSLALDLRAAEADAAAGTGDLAQHLDHVAAGLDGVLEDLREIARGLHPAILADGGLPPALRTLARRSAIPVRLDIQVEGRLPDPVETAAYYTVAEALTNTVKHARATAADIEVAESDGVLHVRVRDNGRGGADFSHGSGLLGLKDRAEALGGRLWLDSAPGVGTTLQISLPLDAPSGPEQPPAAAGMPDNPPSGLDADPGQRFEQPEAAQRAEPGPSAPETSGNGPLRNSAPWDRSAAINAGMASGPVAGGTGGPLARRTGVAPRRVLVAGDWHGNREWAINVLMRVPQLLAGEQKRLILQLGDFGIWPGAEGRRYLGSLTAVLDTVDAELWFVDGNHEDFVELARMASGGTLPDGRVVVRPNIYHLPRGYRWRWHGRTWLACGGGVSLDKAGRVEGRDWWPQEEINRWEETAITASGHADVLVCHDCPSGVEHRFPRPPAWWAAADLSRNDAHRERLQRIADAIRPGHLVHGHLHRAYQRSCDFGYGPVEVTGLAADGVLRNFAVLDTELMTWRTRRRGLLDLGARH